MLAAMPGECSYCNTELTLETGTWDHVIAFDKGGTNLISNIRRCCTNCQRRKFTKTPAEYDEHRAMVVNCALPGCPNTYTPRWAEWQRGKARYCSLKCAGASRWL